MPFMTLFLLLATVIGTALLSGVLGMAGGFILLGVMLHLLAVEAAMTLHGLAQLSSNASRGVLHLKHIRARTVLFYGCGLFVATAIFAAFRFIIDKDILYLCVAMLTFIMLAIPRNLALDAARDSHACIAGLSIGSLQLLTGAGGALFDAFFARSDMSRHQVIATKAACMTMSHIAKIVFFGMLAGGLSHLQNMMPWWFLPAVFVCAVTGTVLSKPLIDRLTDHSFRRITRMLVGGMGLYYLIRGSAGILGLMP